MADKKINKYEQIGRFLSEELMIAEALKSAKEGSTEAPVRNVAASLFPAPETKNYKDYLLKDPEVQTEELVGVLTPALGQQKAKNNKLINDLEGIINDIKDEIDVFIGISITKLKDRYSGAKAETYTKIKELGKKTEEMRGIIDSKDPEKIYKDFKKSENLRLGSIDKDQKALCNALIDSKGKFVHNQYMILAQKTIEELTKTLRSDGKGYLIENLKGKDFREFYYGLVQTKSQAQNQNQNQNQNQESRS